MDKKSFTLIELLVVIATVTVLAVLIMPALGRARHAAKRAQCANNLRQIGIAVNMYADDNWGRIPENSRGLGPLYSMFMWKPKFPGNPTEDSRDGLGHLYPEYIDDLDVFYCPNAVSRGETFIETKAYFDTTGKTAADYEFGYAFRGFNPPSMLNQHTNNVLAHDINRKIFPKILLRWRRANSPYGLNVLWPDGSVQWFGRNPPNDNQTDAEALAEIQAIEAETFSEE